MSTSFEESFRPPLATERVEESLDALQAGGLAAFDAYCARFPADASELHRRLRRLLRIGALSPDALQSPKGAFEGYRILEPLGRGGQAAVYRAEQLALGRTVALKVYWRPHWAPVDQHAWHEARLSARLDHPHIVRMHDVDLEHDPPFVAMEAVDGVSLSEVLEALDGQPRETLRSGDLWSTVRRLTGRPDEEPREGDDGSWDDAVHEVGTAMLAALSHAHDRDVIHRDVKPANILLGVERTIQLTDFGVARSTRDSSVAESVGDLGGTVPFAAPEQLLDPSARHPSVDLHALGVTLRVMRSRSRPRGTPEQLHEQCLRGAIELDEPADGLTSRLQEWTSRDPRRRPATAEDALAQWSSKEADEPSPMARWVAALVAATLLLGWWSMRDRGWFAKDAAADEASLVERDDTGGDGRGLDGVTTRPLVVQDIAYGLNVVVHVPSVDPLQRDGSVGTWFPQEGWESGKDLVRVFNTEIHRRLCRPEIAGDTPFGLRLRRIERDTGIAPHQGDPSPELWGEEDDAMHIVVHKGLDEPTWGEAVSEDGFPLTWVAVPPTPRRTADQSGWAWSIFRVLHQHGLHGEWPSMATGLVEAASLAQLQEDWLRVAAAKPQWFHWNSRCTIPVMAATLGGKSWFDRTAAFDVSRDDWVLDLRPSSGEAKFSARLIQPSTEWHVRTPSQRLTLRNVSLRACLSSFQVNTRLGAVKELRRASAWIREQDVPVWVFAAANLCDLLARDLELLAWAALHGMTDPTLHASRFGPMEFRPALQRDGVRDACIELLGTANHHGDPLGHREGLPHRDKLLLKFGVFRSCP